MGFAYYRLLRIVCKRTYGQWDMQWESHIRTAYGVLTGHTMGYAMGIAHTVNTAYSVIGYSVISDIVSTLG